MLLRLCNILDRGYYEEVISNGQKLVVLNILCSHIHTLWRRSLTRSHHLHPLTNALENKQLSWSPKIYQKGFIRFTSPAFSSSSRIPFQKSSLPSTFQDSPADRTIFAHHPVQSRIPAVKYRRFQREKASHLCTIDRTLLSNKLKINRAFLSLHRNPTACLGGLNRSWKFLRLLLGADLGHLPE